jgi:hypothetical protein
MVKESGEWMTTSLEEILVEGGLWEKGIRSPDPDIPKMVPVLTQEEGPLSGDRDSGKRIEDFSKQIRALFEACRVRQCGDRAKCLHESSTVAPLSLTQSL